MHAFVDGSAHAYDEVSFERQSLMALNGRPRLSGSLMRHSFVSSISMVQASRAEQSGL